MPLVAETKGDWSRRATTATTTTTTTATTTKKTATAGAIKRRMGKVTESWG